MTKKMMAVVFSLILSGSQVASSADLRGAVDEPPTPPIEQVGIWGAISYSETDGNHGFFWGADKRQEAEDIAVEHCKNAGGKNCALVMTFRNHRHWDDNDESGFPYNHCAALAVSGRSAKAFSPWATASAKTRKDAEDQALQQCGGASGECKIREWVCT
jgi:hypothetical protein